MSMNQTQPSPHDLRVSELYRMNRPRLAAIIRSRRNIVWTASPLERWSKDELINDILRDEFTQTADGSWVTR